MRTGHSSYQGVFGWLSTQTAWYRTVRCNNGLQRQRREDYSTARLQDQGWETTAWCDKCVNGMEKPFRDFFSFFFRQIKSHNISCIFYFIFKCSVDICSCGKSLTDFRFLLIYNQNTMGNIQYPPPRSEIIIWWQQLQHTDEVTVRRHHSCQDLLFWWFTSHSHTVAQAISQGKFCGDFLRYSCSYTVRHSGQVASFYVSC